VTGRVIRRLFAPIGEASKMKRVNQYQFYQMGVAIHPMTELKRGATVQDIWIECWQAQQWLDYLLADNVTPLFTCRAAAQKLRNALADIVPELNTSPAPTPEERAAILAQEVDQYTIWGITNKAKEFETVFAAELETADTYFVSQKGIYSTSHLVEKAEQAFTLEVQGQLSPQAIQDIRQAGKCLAFDLDTASGFHVVRATEMLIHKYYIAVTGTTPKRKDRNWGAYVRNLNAHRKSDPNSKADPKLIMLIDQVREHHRNPVIHPEITLTPDEAQSLFSICQAVIITFATALVSIGGQLPLKIVNAPILLP
jgi:hypothetical protein